MGQAISSFLKTVDQADQKQASQKEAIEALRSLAEAKKDLWLAEIESGIGQNMKKMFADTLIDFQFKTIIGIKKEDNVGDAISGILEGFTNKSLIGGISNAISTVASRVIQNTESGEAKEIGYKIILGPMGSVGRVDYFLYQYTFKNLGLEASHQSVFLYAYVHSAVNIGKVDNVNAFKVLIDSCYKDLTLSERKAILDEIYTGLERAIKDNK